MEWEYFESVWKVGLIALVIQLLGFLWERRTNTAWQALRVPVTLKQVLLEWASYMLIFIMVSMVLRGVLHLTCSFCLRYRKQS